MAETETESKFNFQLNTCMNTFKNFLEFLTRIIAG